VGEEVLEDLVVLLLFLQVMSPLGGTPSLLDKLDQVVGVLVWDQVVPQVVVALVGAQVAPQVVVALVGAQVASQVVVVLVGAQVAPQVVVEGPGGLLVLVEGLRVLQEGQQQWEACILPIFLLLLSHLD
jgi:hypothetical protein